MSKNRKRLKNIEQNLVKQEFFVLDLINMVLGTAILVFAVLALLGYGGFLFHALVFLMGGILMSINCIKNLKRKSLISVAFGIFAIVMFGIAGFLFRALLSA